MGKLQRKWSIPAVFLKAQLKMFELLPAFKYFGLQHKLALFALNDFLSQDLHSASCQLFLAKLSKAIERLFLSLPLEEGLPEEAKQAWSLD